MGKTVEFICLLLSLLIFVNAVLAQTVEWGDFFSVDYLWTDVFGLSSDWLQPKLFLFNFLVPFVAIFAVCLGLLRALRIFERTPNIEMVLAFAMAFMTLPSHIFIAFVNITLGLGGMWSYGIFILLFLVGTGYYVFYRFRMWGTMADTASSLKQARDSISDNLSQIGSRRTQITVRLGQPNLSPAEVASLNNELNQLDQREQQLLLQMKTLKREVSL